MIFFLVFASGCGDSIEESKNVVYVEAIEVLDAKKAMQESIPKIKKYEKLKRIEFSILDSCKDKTAAECDKKEEFAAVKNIRLILLESMESHTASEAKKLDRVLMLERSKQKR